MSKFFLLLLILSISSLSYEQTLRETTFCEVSNSQIQNKARGLKKSSTLETAKHIFSFVQVDIKYESYSNTKKGAVRTLNERKGNCADQAHLLLLYSVLLVYQQDMFMELIIIGLNVK